MAAVTDKKPEPTLGEILKNAGRRALGGGLPGAAAMAIQVCSLMWLRTTMNYQYRHGTSTTVALKTLYSQGGILRFYRGIGPALIQGPMSRFGDTAANAGVLALLDSYETTKKLPVGFKTLCASGGAASWRLLLMPVDTVKTILQVEGKQGLPILMQKFKKGGVPVFFQGAIAASGATFVGHFPWFFTYNYLNDTLPKAETKIGKLTRNASMGFCASVVSDTCSNSIRVVKTTKQTSAVPLTYVQSVQLVLKEDGWIGLFGRGLRTRILANALQGMLFSVLWKQFEEMYWKNQRK
eukprot:comp12603_c0_seq1/m.7630 comp12603_c0_seq1/g.7630  ORF comp12603_c0_seq1/g.7630 comp12603_c0_seq1/m.7630 type:complete len:295 (-) comp12603_c0_seq1:52-936(-)